MEELSTIPEKFNSIFGNKGWIVYDTMNFQIIKEAVLIAETNRIEIAEEFLFSSLKPDKISFEVNRLHSVPQLQERYKFIQHAYAEYKNEKYISVIPILLMIIDGSVADTLGKGFHAKNIDLDVWDAITTIDGGINKIKDIFRKGRNKTTKEKILLPYRNGILHGRDLEYDNFEVAAKCWHFLFAIADWIRAKSSESERHDKFLMEKNPPRISDLIKEHIELENKKKFLSDWNPRVLSDNYIKSLNSNCSINSNFPEFALIEFLKLWKNKNFGNMAKIYSHYWREDEKLPILYVKNMFKDIPLNSYLLENIIDEASAISEIMFQIINDSNKIHYKARLIYEGENGEPYSSNSGLGNWKINSIIVIEK
ncbi:MAG: hypothetical protein KDC88_14775 [Ignavibacteriae bacterium]|nr:hypothetical protein [Ignavibacteriota bacterium]